MIVSLIDKVTTGTKCLALFIWNVAEVFCIAALPGTGGLASDLPGTSDVIDVSDIIHSLDHDKSKFYCTFNQWQIERSPKITQIF